MGERRSSQRRPLIPSRDSSVTKVLSHLISEGSSQSVSPNDNQATVISNRPVESDSSPPLLVALEMGKLLEGEKLGQFELKKFVGGGGMGVVFRAWDTTLNREVAVKVLSRDQSADDETLRRFRNEAQSAARLDHGNIARVYFVGEDRGVHYIVFEFIEGVNLRDLVDRHGPLPVDEAIEFTLQIAEALDHASQRDVIHRDIKPSNVLITEHGVAKLVDMGLARLHQVEHTNNDLTASGVTLGTFDYISPEQARDPRSADVRSDLYSLGCSLYFMLLGRPPFPNGTVLQKLLQHQGDEPTDPGLLRPDLPTDLLKILHKLLAKVPADRYQTPSELIEDLNAFKQHRPLVAGANEQNWSENERTKTGAGERHLPWLIPVATLIVVCIGLELYWRREFPVDGNTTFPVFIDRPTLDGGSKAIEKEDSTKAPTAEEINLQKPLVDQLATEPISSVPSPSRAAAQRPANGLLNELHGQLHTSGTERLTNGILVVADGGLPGTYGSLKAASQAAQNGDVIELRYNGRRTEQPFQIENRKITIRASDGYTPIISFRPEERMLDDQSPAMISLIGGNLTVMNLEMEMFVPTDATTDTWSLIEAQQVDGIRLINSVLTVHNATSGGIAFHPHAYFIDVPPSPPVDPIVSLIPDVSTRPLAGPVAIELEDCFIRGEATFLHVNGGSSAQVVWNNGLIATSERMFYVTGSEDAEQPARLAVNGRHLTIDTARGLAWLDFTSDSESGLLVDLQLAGCILIGNSTSPMIEQIVTETELAAGGPFHWSGDRNFYEGYEIFWKRGESADTDLTQQVGFAEWRRFWGQNRETLPYLNAVEWQSSDAISVTPSRRTPANYLLSASVSSNPAKDSADDGIDAGCIHKKLPAVGLH